MDDGHQWEGWYAANDSTIFTFVTEYLNMTGDLALLDEKVGDKTVLEHLDALATNWQEAAARQERDARRLWRKQESAGMRTSLCPSRSLFQCGQCVDDAYHG